MAGGAHAGEMFTTAMKLVKLGGHVANVSGFFGDETVTIPMEVWNYGVMEKFLTSVLANTGRDYLERRSLSMSADDTTLVIAHTSSGAEALAKKGRNADVVSALSVSGSRATTC